MKLEKYLPKIQKSISLKNYTTFKIGGPAKYFFVVKKKEDLIKAVKAAKEAGLPFFILGGGSNILISDKGYKGLLIKIQNSKFKIQNSKIVTEAGVKLGQLVRAATEEGLTGLEWAVGIPGTVGGAIYGNAGAFGKEMRDIAEIVRVFDENDLKFKICKGKDCKFGYRDSAFKKKKNLIIISIELKLKKGNKIEIKKRIKKHLDYKKTTRPLNFPSAGSIFKNFTFYRNEISGAGPKELIKFKKIGVIPTAWLIEKCGLKGKKSGSAQISKKHANFIVNLSNAKAKDVLKLIKLIKKQVKNKFGIVLKEEIQFLDV